VEGFTVASAQAAIAAADLTNGNVTIASLFDAAPNDRPDGTMYGGLVRRAFADDPATAIVTACIPACGTFVLRGSTVGLTATFPASDMPEPSSLAMLIVGLFLLLGLYWWRGTRATAPR